METTMFTLGILSIISAASVALVIYGTVKVLKLKTEITEIWRRLHENNQDMYRSIESTGREIKTLEDLVKKEEATYSAKSGVSQISLSSQRRAAGII